MNTVLSHAADLLTRALKQVDHAHRHLNAAKRYAAAHDQEKLEQGTSELIVVISRLTTDLQTLLGVLRARAQFSETE